MDYNSEPASASDINLNQCGNNISRRDQSPQESNHSELSSSDQEYFTCDSSCSNADDRNMDSCPNVDDRNTDTDTASCLTQSDNESPSNKQPITGCSKTDEFNWTPLAELELLKAMIGLRPVGAHYHIYIPIIYARFCKAMRTTVPLEQVKQKLNTLYNFDEALKMGGEDFCSPQSEFSLPLDEFPEVGEMMARMEKEGSTSSKPKSADD